MEIWILVVIAIRNKLEQAVKNAEHKIMKVALNPTLDALKQSAIISDFINEKNMLINLKVLYDRIEETLSLEEMKFLKDFISCKDSWDVFCLRNKIIPTLLLDKVEEYATKGATALKKLGLTVGKMQEDYGNLTLVSLSIMNIKRIIKQTKARSKAIVLTLNKLPMFNSVAI